jgi:hypothetical protein
MDRPADEETRLAIDLALFYKVGGALPRAGGVFDQYPEHIRMIKAGLRAFAKQEERENERAAKKRR